MPECPKCRTTIYSLNGDFMEWNRYKCELEKGSMDCEFKSVNGTADENGDYQHYYCPECDKQITDKYDEAEAFLNGEKIEVSEED